MKKISILLILCMIISLIPALNISAADETGAYYLKGIYNGATVVIQHEPTKTVTLVDIANEGKTTTTATNVSKVVFTFNNGASVTDNTAPFSYTMEFTKTGSQTLKYDVYKTTGDGITPDQSTTVTFNVVSGIKNSASFTENFDTIASDKVAATIVANDGASKSAGMVFTTQEVNVGSGYFKSDGKALKITGTTRFTYMLFKGVPSDTGHKLHYYSFDLGMNTANSHGLYVSGSALENISNNTVELFRNKDIGTHSGNQNKRRVDILLDYNKNVAVVKWDGVERSVMDISAATTGANDPALKLYFDNYAAAMYIDNFSYTVYDVMSFTGASIAGGDDDPVLKDLDEIRFTGGGYLEGQVWTDLVTISPAVDFTPYADGSDVVVEFNEDLAAGETYTVSISGVKDNYHSYYPDYTFTFRTLGEDENPKPEVTLLSPEAGKRFYPLEDTIILSAKATDEVGGSVTHVEFYVNDVLIQTVYSADAVDDIYTCAPWTPDESYNYAGDVEIVVKAYDDGKVLEFDREVGVGESTPVKVTILCNEHPAITITSPAEGKVYQSNLAGKIVDVKPTINFEATDVDGKIAAINIYVDSVNIGSVAKPEEDKSYTLTQALDAGEHTIVVEAYDDHGDSSIDDIKIIVDDTPCGKAGYILNEDYTAEELFAKWNKSGNATFEYGALSNYADIKGVVISGAAGSANRAITRNLADEYVVADVKVAFNDTTTKRTISFGTAEMATFEADGTITYGKALVEGRKYQAGEVYTLSAVVDAASGKVYALFNGEEIGSTSATYTANTKITVAHDGAGETAIIAASLSLIGEAVEPTVDVAGNKITVTFPAGVDKATLEGNVSVVNVETGKAVSLIYENGVFTINEVLKYATEYQVIVLPDVRDINGNSYSGSYIEPFRTEEPETTVGIADVTVDGASLVEGEFTATLEVVFNGAEETKTVYLVCAAYNGTKMEDYQVIELTSPATASDKELALSGVSEGAVVEAFVVDSLDDLNSVSDKIFIIR